MDMETLRAVLARIMKGGDTPEKQMGRMQRDALAERDQMDEDRYMGDERASDAAKMSPRSPRRDAGADVYPASGMPDAEKGYSALSSLRNEQGLPYTQRPMDSGPQGWSPGKPQAVPDVRMSLGKPQVVPSVSMSLGRPQVVSQPSGIELQREKIKLLRNPKQLAQSLVGAEDLTKDKLPVGGITEETPDLETGSMSLGGKAEDVSLDELLNRK